MTSQEPHKACKMLRGNVCESFHYLLPRLHQVCLLTDISHTIYMPTSADVIPELNETTKSFRYGCGIMRLHFWHLESLGFLTTRLPSKALLQNHNTCELMFYANKSFPICSLHISKALFICGATGSQVL